MPAKPAEKLNAEARPGDAIDQSLRPARLSDFAGQPKLRERLTILLDSARARSQPLDHLLLSGPPGLGKTTLAHILGAEMKATVRTTSGPAIEKAGDLAGLLTGLQEGDILFIDEIHRLSKVIEEYLYPALEDFRIDIVIDQGPAARSVRLNLPRFTLIGATTRAGLLSAPLRSRFGVAHRLDYYSVEDLTRIVRRSAQLLETNLEDSAAPEIARRSRGTPRISNNLLRWVRDYALARSGGKAVIAALEMLEIDRHGLDEMDKRLLQALTGKFKGGPAGLHSLAAAVGEEAGTLEEVHEPYLILEGYLQRTPQGRVALPRAYEVLGLKPPASQTQLL
jgi:Holliday junction DNA helicase RuvB